MHPKFSFQGLFLVPYQLHFSAQEIYLTQLNQIKLT